VSNPCTHASVAAVRPITRTGVVVTRPACSLGLSQEPTRDPPDHIVSNPCARACASMAAVRPITRTGAVATRPTRSLSQIQDPTCAPLVHHPGYSCAFASRSPIEVYPWLQCAQSLTTRLDLQSTWSHRIRLGFSGGCLSWLQCTRSFTQAQVGPDLITLARSRANATTHNPVKPFRSSLFHTLHIMGTSSRPSPLSEFPTPLCHLLALGCQLLGCGPFSLR